MKNFLILCFIATSGYAVGQQTINLKVAYLPDHRYTLESSNTTKMVMDVQADDATREQMKSQGMAFPVIMDMVQDMTVLMTTGKINDKQEVPITVEYSRFDIKQKMGDKEMPTPGNLLQDIKASGFADSKGKMRFENIEGAGVTDDVRKMMTAVTDQLGVQIAFPEQPMKVGDEFTQEIPLDMNVQEGAKLKMMVKTTYKLISFDRNNAFFDTVISMTMDMAADSGSLNASGSGAGKMTFDIKRKFMDSYNSTLDMIMNMKMGPMDMNVKSNAVSTVKVNHP